MYKFNENLVSSLGDKIENSGAVGDKEDLEKMFNLSPDMQCICTPEGKIIYVNLACEKMLGYNADEILKLGWAKLVHPDDVKRTTDEVKKQLEGQAVLNFINRYQCKDGTYVTLEWQASPAINGIVYATARDITERIRMEEELRSHVRASEILQEEKEHIFRAGLFGNSKEIRNKALIIHQATLMFGNSQLDIEETKRIILDSSKKIIEILDITIIDLEKDLKDLRNNMAHKKSA